MFPILEERVHPEGAGRGFVAFELASDVLSPWAMVRPFGKLRTSKLTIKARALRKTLKNPKK